MQALTHFKSSWWMCFYGTELSSSSYICDAASVWGSQPDLLKETTVEVGETHASWRYSTSINFWGQRLPRTCWTWSAIWRNETNCEAEKIGIYRTCFKKINQPTLQMADWQTFLHFPDVKKRLSLPTETWTRKVPAINFTQPQDITFWANIYKNLPVCAQKLCEQEKTLFNSAVPVTTLIPAISL